MVPFLFAVHGHQPVGNFGWVFEKAVEKCYQPYLETLAEFPSLKTAIHYSGCLLEWIEQHRPAHVELLRKMVSRGQVELLGSGFMEPILPAIPERDARAQITSYADHLEQLLGKRPRGIWLTERVWDPGLPKLLQETGVEFTLVDDSHFRFAGLDPADVWGPWLTEREGKSVTILPIDKQLRYMIPFAEPQAVLDYIVARGENTPGFIACYGDDTEKFGIWPDTFEWVHEKGWLKKFFTLLQAASGKIKTVHFSEHLAGCKPRGRIYLPPASYDEMMEWTLPPRLGRALEHFTHELKEEKKWDALSPFVRGGHWDMFLGKYEESNRMHKRMLLCSERIAAKKNASAEAITHLHRSQCNCAYWHGVFGGLYLNYLRHAIYQEILAAENKAKVVTGLQVEERDYDLDGEKEIIISSPAINFIIHPARGGAVGAIEVPAKLFSLMNVMSRREEAYHEKLTQKHDAADADAPKTIHDRVVMKEEGLDKFLVCDRFPRMSLQEHIVPPLLSLEEIEGETTIELGEFAGAPYSVVSRGKDRVVLKREDKAGEVPVMVEKTITWQDGKPGFDAAYVITGTGKRPVKLRFAVEFNLTLLAGDAPDRYYLIDGVKPEEPMMNGRAVHPETRAVSLVNEFDRFAAEIAASEPMDLHRFPVETVSQSESGFERTYQGSALWFSFPLNLDPGYRREFSFSLIVRDLK